jgi:hypothetical protein
MPDFLLSAGDREALAELKRKTKLIRTRVRGVVENYATGFYLWGEGGTSKSYTVLEELRRLRADYVMHNSRMTGRGLFDRLKKMPSSVHIIEDCESIFDDRRAWGVLRSALWSQSKERPMKREVTWSAFNADFRFTFTGGVILIANRGLDSIPELNALATRISVLQLLATFPEVAALMRSVAMKGYVHGQDFATPHECLTVAEFIIDKTRALERPLDMRVFVNGVLDYLQAKNDAGDADWRHLIETRLHRTTVLPQRRADVIGREASIALELSRMNVCPAERMRLWTERTGKSARAYWRRLRGLENALVRRPPPQG